MVSAIDGLPAEPTPFAATDKLTDDDITESVLKSMQPPTSAPSTDHMYNNLHVTTWSQSLKRVKRKFVHRPLFVYRRYHQQDRVVGHGDVPKSGINNRNDRYHYRRNYINFAANESYNPPSAINLYATLRRTKRRVVHRPLFVFREFHLPNRGPDHEHEGRKRI